MSASLDWPVCWTLWFTLIDLEYYALKCGLAFVKFEVTRAPSTTYMLAVLPIYPDFTHFGLIWIHLIRENQLIIFDLPEWPIN